MAVEISKDKRKEDVLLLMAKDQYNCYVSLLSLPRDALDEYKRKIYYCPCCTGRVFLKAGKIKMPHFAHAPHLTCNAASEGETEEHLLGKKVLYEWLDSQGYEVELEKYFSSFKQRADLFIKHKGRSFAIEFQCSVISLEDIKKRTKSYMKHHISPIWILSERHVKWKKNNSFMLSAFHWLSSSGTILLPKLIAFSPKNSQFTILQQLTPFSERHVFAYPKIVHLQSLTFSALLDTSILYPLRNQIWQNKKQSWRLHSASYATFDHPFFKALYGGGLSPATIPNECGIPVPYMHLYQTSVIQWQFWLYDQVLRKRNTGDFVSLGEWRSALVCCLKEEKIVIRHIPHTLMMNPFLPMEQYILMLEKLGVLKREKNGHIYASAIEPFNPSSPQKEDVFYQAIKQYYEELMAKACFL